ncbi:hypothetical protein M9980_01690 [Sphingomonas donggukensis]|uniref:Uncharacterized protein n=1 Tax=Sphingomonas donggukensis TaxID=2949093 RepID=A0ABY4TU87_9SPHN|nr:hypothetical protein [Sphingomonas donggukensis]URW75968.1 hypothetical protein M9980_01690 [Sphingomonas donggukensis]
MTLRLLIALFALLLSPLAVVTPACASETPASESSASSQHDAGQHQQQRRQNDKAKPGQGQCLGCVAPSTARPPLLEAPNRALMMIPAAHIRISHALKPARPHTPPPKQA